MVFYFAVWVCWVLFSARSLPHAYATFTFVYSSFQLKTYICTQYFSFYQQLREYQLKQKAAPAVNHDAAILKALEMLLTPPPPVIDRLHEYKVLTVRPKVPVPVRTVPVVIPVPAPKEVDPPKVEVKEVAVTVEVQTDPVPIPVAPTPVVPVVTPVLQQPSQVVVNVPAQNTVERELIDLMHNVVNTQHQTMQGNQALILSLIHERNTQNVYQEIIEYAPPVVEAPAPVPAPRSEERRVGKRVSDPV